MKRFILAAFFVSMIIFMDSQCWSFEKETHRAISQQIVEQNLGINLVNGLTFDEFLKNQLNIEDGISHKFDNITPLNKLIGKGAFNEDWTIIRSCNHFHNPLKPLEQAGLDAVIANVLYNGSSSILWMLNPNQDIGPKRSWKNLKDYYYSALTAQNQNDRNIYFAETFESLGHVMHLVEDASVPAHTRNDVHILYNYEDWVEAIRTSNVPADVALFNSYTSVVQNVPFSNGIFNTNPGTVSGEPIANLIDNNLYVSDPSVLTNPMLGISEYTNGNFFSEDTTFDANFPYPNRNSVQVQSYVIDELGGVEREYYKKVADGEVGYKAATVGFLADYVTTYMPGYQKPYLFWIKETLDEKCYQDYAERLVPRAYKYAANVLNYFFRGQIEAVDPTTTTDASGNITGMTLKARNKTPKVGGTSGEIEPIGGGSNDRLRVSYQYSSGGQTTFGNSTTLTFDNYSGHTYEFTGFKPPIPADATDNKYMLVYRGKLGDENDAVAAKCFNPGVHSLVLRHPGGITDYTWEYKAEHYFGVYDAAWASAISGRSNIGPYGLNSNKMLTDDEILSAVASYWNIPGAPPHQWLGAIITYNGYRTQRYYDPYWPTSWVDLVVQGGSSTPIDYYLSLYAIDVAAPPIPSPPPDFDCAGILGLLYPPSPYRFSPYVYDHTDTYVWDSLWLVVHGDCSAILNPINIKAGEEYGLYVAYKGTKDLPDFWVQFYGSGHYTWENVTIEASDKPGFKKLSFIADHDFTLTDIYVEADTLNTNVEINLAAFYHGDEIIDSFDGYEGDVRRTTYPENEWSATPKPIETNKEIKWSITDDYGIGPNYDEYLATLTDSSF